MLTKGQRIEEKRKSNGNNPLRGIVDFWVDRGEIAPEVELSKGPNVTLPIRVVTDLIVDSNEFTSRQQIVSVGGLLGVARRTVAVPFSRRPKKVASRDGKKGLAGS